MSDSDTQLIGWLHRMSALSDEDLVSQFDNSCKDRLVRLVERCVPVESVPADLSPWEFACWVNDLRSSEKEWNRALGNVLLKVADAERHSNPDTAIDILREFVVKCPWIPLSEIAREELRRFGGSA